MSKSQVKILETPSSGPQTFKIKLLRKLSSLSKDRATAYRSDKRTNSGSYKEHSSTLQQPHKKKPHSQGSQHTFGTHPQKDQPVFREDLCHLQESAKKIKLSDAKMSETVSED